MIRHILRKDCLLLWPMVALVTAIQVGLEWAAYRAGFFNADAAAVELLRPLTLAWYAGIAALTVAVVQQDPLPGIDHDWLVRPIKRRDLLIAKLLFVVLTISLPMFVVNLAHAAMAGFPLVLSVEVTLWKELYLFICMLVPLLALASITRNMAELSVLGAALVVIYALALFASAMLLGSERCPTCSTGLSWQQHLLQHLELLIGSAVVLGLQYFRRRTGLSRALAVIGTVLLIAVQVPWSSAFALQRSLSGTGDAPPGFSLKFAPGAAAAFSQGTDAESTGSAARQAARSILRGDLDKAVDSLRKRGTTGAPAVLDLPLDVAGLSDRDKLLTDRSHIEIRNSRGKLLDVASSVEGTATGLNFPDDGAEGLTHAHETVIVPKAVVSAAHAGALSVRSLYSLTLVTLAAQHDIPSAKGRIRTADIGLCETRTDDYAVHLRCTQIGPAPFCFSATLYAPDGRHNPETLNCEPDYRPFLPAASSLLNSSGLDVHYRDPHGLTQFPIDPSEVPQTHLVIRIYRVRAHLERALVLTSRPGA